MSRPKAIILMILITLLWSTAGVVTRSLDSSSGFEATFWRSAFNAMALGVGLTIIRGPGLLHRLLHAPKVTWISGICWSIMFTAFMVAITLTTVANVLIIMALGPLITALFARFFLQHRLSIATWLSIVVAGLGMIWMFTHDATAAFSFTGSLISLLVPLSAALNFTILQHVSLRQKRGEDPSKDKPTPDMLQSILIGAVLSALLCLPLSRPFQTSVHDLGLLAFLGIFQLAIPCLLVVHLTRDLSAPEISLLSQLEILFGVTWAWLWAGEQLSTNTLAGGSLMIGALITSEVFRIVQQRKMRRIVTNH